MLAEILKVKNLHQVEVLYNYSRNKANITSDQLANKTANGKNFSFTSNISGRLLVLMSVYGDRAAGFISVGSTTIASGEAYGSDSWVMQAAFDITAGSTLSCNANAVLNTVHTNLTILKIS